MKKIIIALIFLAVISPVFAQSNSDEDSDIYYINVSVEKIYPTSQGYIVQYRTQMGMATIGIPNSWFTEAAGRAGMMRLPSGSTWPSMSVFYSHGEFTHLRLYVSARGHNTWGSIPQGTDVSRFFSDDDSFQLKF